MEASTHGLSIWAGVARHEDPAVAARASDQQLGLVSTFVSIAYVLIIDWQRTNSREEARGSGWLAFACRPVRRKLKWNRERRPHSYDHARLVCTFSSTRGSLPRRTSLCGNLMAGMWRLGEFRENWPARSRLPGWRGPGRSRERPAPTPAVGARPGQSRSKPVMRGRPRFAHAVDPPRVAGALRRVRLRGPDPLFHLFSNSLVMSSL